MAHKGKEKDAFKLNAEAASRDYHVNPRLGTKTFLSTIKTNNQTKTRELTSCPCTLNNQTTGLCPVWTDLW